MKFKRMLRKRKFMFTRIHITMRGTNNGQNHLKGIKIYGINRIIIMDLHRVKGTTTTTNGITKIMIFGGREGELSMIRNEITWVQINMYQ